MRSTGSHVAVKEAKIGAMTSIRPFKMEFRTFQNGRFFMLFVAMIYGKKNVTFCPPLACHLCVFFNGGGN